MDELSQNRSFLETTLEVLEGKECLKIRGGSNERVASKRVCRLPGDVLLHPYEVKEEVSAPCHLHDQKEQAEVSACQAIQSELYALCNLCVTDLAEGR